MHFFPKKPARKLCERLFNDAPILSRVSIENPEPPLFDIPICNNLHPPYKMLIFLSI